MHTEAAICCAELALSAMQDARALLDESAWPKPPVSLQPQRTVWAEVLPPAPGPSDGSGGGSRESVYSVRSVGRVRGESIDILTALIMDDGFRRWNSEQRSLAQMVVPEQLWTVHATALMSVPNIQARDLVYVCAHAEEPDGRRLIIERSVRHPSWPPQPAAVRAWRFFAVQLSPVGSTILPLQPVGRHSKDALPPIMEQEVELCLVLQLDLGDLTERFTSQFALESAELINAISTYISHPGWEVERKRLEAEGSRLPAPRRIEVPSRGASRKSSADAHGRSPRSSRTTHRRIGTTGSSSRRSPHACESPRRDSVVSSNGSDSGSASAGHASDGEGGSVAGGSVEGGDWEPASAQSALGADDGERHVEEQRTGRISVDGSEGGDEVPERLGPPIMEKPQISAGSDLHRAQILAMSGLRM